MDKTRSAGFIIRVVMDELEKNGSLGSAVGKDVGGNMSIMKEFQRLVADSRGPQVSAAAAKTMHKLRRRVARRRWKRAISAIRLIVRLSKRSKSNDSLRKDVDIKETDRAVGRVRQANVHESRQVKRDSASTLTRGLKTEITIGRIITTNDNSSKSLNSISSVVVRDIATETLHEPRFFREGSLMSNLIESGIEVVWFDDRHPNDVVYSICCNRREKCVSVVFRGSANLHNWLMNMKFAMSEHANPIAEDYPGREEMLGLHTGFALYMLRQRRDNDLTKIEEIFSKIDGIGRELAPNGEYELSIAGHSLGGALATLLSFYAASSKVFANVKTIRAFTFASPRVGKFMCTRSLLTLA